MSSVAVTNEVRSVIEAAPPLQLLHPNARINSVISNAIAFVILTIVGCVIEVIIARSSRVWMWPTYLPVISLIAGTVITLAAMLMASMRYSRFGYHLREHDLIVASGLIWKSRRCVPRARIQHVDIDSGPIDRALGLVEVKLYVAGGIGAVAELPGLSPEAAEQLKEALIVSRTDGV